MICYEAIFPAEVREFTQAGAQFLVQITNDAWFGRSGAQQQHLAMAAMRAVEERDVPRARREHGDHGGGRAFRTDRRQPRFLRRSRARPTIWPRRDRTAYSRYGDVFPWACLICFGASGLVPGIRRYAGSAGRRMAQRDSHDS